jgi:hypothetical protein
MQIRQELFSLWRLWWGYSNHTPNLGIKGPLALSHCGFRGEVNLLFISTVGNQDTFRKSVVSVWLISVNLTVQLPQCIHD